MEFFLDDLYRHLWASLMAQMVMNSPAVRETWVWSLGWKDSPGGGYSNPLQYSCLENPQGRRSLAAVHEVAKSWTWLRNLSTAQHRHMWEHISRFQFIIVNGCIYYCVDYFYCHNYSNILYSSHFHMSTFCALTFVPKQWCQALYGSLSHLLLTEIL